MIAAADTQTLAWVADFERIEKASGGEPSWLRKMRRDGIERFADVGFPTTHDEDWRFTNVAPIARTRFAVAPRASVAAPEIFRDTNAIRLVFVNGHLDSQAPAAGIAAGSLRESLGNSRVAEHFSDGRANPFAALNTAFFEDGAFVEIPKGFVLERPLHLVFVSTADQGPAVSHPRNLLVIGPEAQATIIESYVGLGDEPYFTNAVTEIVAGEGSVVDHYKFQDERAEAFHIAMLETRQERGSSLATSSLSFGGALVRNDITAVLSEGAECTLNGLYLAGGRQHVDHHTTIDHARPHAASREFYKGILVGRSTAVFNGRIVVRKDAQKTDAKQTNKNLVLSDEATINTKPELKIFADDVRCTHGATVGQIDAEALFYLRSRGIGEAKAREMLTVAFAQDMLDRVKVESLRSRLEELLSARLSEGKGIGAK